MQQIGSVQNNAMLNVRYDAGEQELPYRAGDMVTAEVLRADGDKLLLRLDGGPVIRATSEQGVTLSQGDIVNMLVTGRSDADDRVRMTMRLTGAPTADETAPGGAASALLARIGVQAGESAALVAQALARSGHSVSAATITAALDITEAFPQLSAEEAVFLALNNTGARPGAGMVEALLARVAGGETIDAPLNALSGDAEGIAAALSGGLSGATSNTADKAAEALQPYPQSAALDAQPGSPLHTLVERLVSGDGGAQQTANMPSIQQSVPAAAETVIHQARALVAEAAALPADQAAERIAAFVESLGTPRSGDETRIALASLLGRATAQLSGEARMNDARALLTAIERVFADMRDGFDAQALNRAVGDTPARIAAVRDAIALMKPTDEAISSAYAARGERAAQHARLTQEVQQYLYVQVPMQAFGKRTSAELYVMQRDPHRRAIDPEHVTMLIALETERMGRVETMVQVERRDVTLKLRVADDVLVSYVKTRAVNAHRLMREAGYTLRELSAQLIRSPIDPVNVERVLLEEFKGERRMLDVSI